MTVAGVTKPQRDAARGAVADARLASQAVEAIVRSSMSTVPPAMIDRARHALRRFFSDGPWSIDDDTALAALVGPGAGWRRTELRAGITLAFGWKGSVFRVDVEVSEPDPMRGDLVSGDLVAGDLVAGGSNAEPAVVPATTLASTFDVSIVPEAGPQPRIVRFLTGPGTGGQSGWIRDAGEARDGRAAALLRAFPDATGVLLGAGFVAVEIKDERRWDEVLAPLFAFVADRFMPPRAPAAPDHGVTRARAELAPIDPTSPRGIATVRDALTSPDAAVRQIAATLVRHDDPKSAERAWRRLLDDTSRAVRRAAVITMSEEHLEEVRPLLERGLGENDACSRFHAALGLGRIGAERSRVALERASADGDARVRLAVEAALAGRNL